MAQIVCSTCCTYRSVPIEICLQGSVQEGAGEAWAFELNVDTILEQPQAPLVSACIFSSEHDATKAALEWASRVIDLALRPIADV